MSSSGSDIEFPNVGLRTLSAVIHFVGTAVLAGCLSRRVALEDLGTLRGWRSLSVARLTIILIFADSLAFLMLTGILIHGVGLEWSSASCSLAIFSCIALYTSSKVLIYIFLSEKVWLVWSNMGSSKGGTLGAIGVPSDAAPAPSIIPKPMSALGRRLRSPVYLVCFTSVTFYLACFVLLLVYRIAHRRNKDGSCVIGLERKASIPLLSYDVYITVLLTGLFVWPLRSNRVMSHRLRRLATRTLLASFVALATSTVNIAILTSLHGHELGWLCLASCGTDVMINALVLDFVTESRLKRYSRHSRVRPALTEDRTSGATPGASTRPAGRSRTAAIKTGTIELTGGTTHSVELRGGGPSENIDPSALPLSSSESGPKLGGPGSPRLASSYLVGDSSEASRTDSASTQAKSNHINHDLRATSSTSSLHSVAKAYSIDSREPHMPSDQAATDGHSLNAGRTHGSKRCDHPRISSDTDYGERDAHDDDPQRCDYYIDTASDDDFEHDEPHQSVPTQQPTSSPRLFTFTEAIHDLDALRPPLHPARSSPDASESPKKLRWSLARRQLPILKPMQPPPGAGYLGTSRRMSMPLSPDDIDLDDFHAPSSSALTWGRRPGFMGTLPEHGGPSEGDLEAQDPYLSVPTSAPPFTFSFGKGKGVQRDADTLFGGFSFPRRGSLPFMDRGSLTTSTISEPPIGGPLDRRHSLLPTSTPSPLAIHAYPPGAKSTPSQTAPPGSPVPPEDDIACTHPSLPS